MLHTYFMCCRFNYFLRNGTQGWRSLGGVVLCITGVSHRLCLNLKAPVWCHCMHAGVHGHCTPQLVAGTDPQQVLCSPHVSPHSHGRLKALMSSAEVPLAPPRPAAPMLPACAIIEEVPCCLCLRIVILPASSTPGDRCIFGTYCFTSHMWCLQTEALFADLGHFSRYAIQISTFGLLWPSLILTYLGQAAYLTK